MEPPARQVDVVIPTAGRASLDRLLAALAPQRDLLGEIHVVEDREGRGPAAARNAGWRASSAAWVAFLDDDVVPGRDWASRLRDDLTGLAAGVAASQGRVRVPLRGDRRPSDWERHVAGLELLDGLGQCDPGPGHRRLERIERDDDEVDRRDVVAREGVEVGGHVTA